MMPPFVIDANAIHEFQQERLEGISGRAHNVIEGIFMRATIAIDEEKLCLQEWVDCAGGSFPFALLDWINDQLVAGNIVFANLSPNNCRKALLKLGLPEKDHKWIRLTIGCGGNTLVTEDVDFFDPTKKNATSQVKAAIKSSGRGACAKSLYKDYNIRVMCLEHIEQELSEV